MEQELHVRLSGMCRDRRSRHLGYRPILVLLVTLIACFVSAALSADEDAFTLSKLSVADKLLDLLPEDLDGDGLKDILVIHRKGLPPNETRWVSIFWQDSSGVFSTAADQSWMLDTAAVIMDIGDVFGDEKKEICYLTPWDVRFYAVESGLYATAPSVLFRSSGLTVFPSKRRIPLINFVRDWNDDGRDEVGIFKFEGLSIYSLDSTGTFSPENEILIELDTGMARVESVRESSLTSGLHARFTFPNISLADYDSNGRKDLITSTEDRVFVYCQKPDGRFVPEPDKDVRFDVLTQHEKIEGSSYVETVINDLDNDGYADVVVTKQTSKGLSNFRGVVNIFRGKPGGFTTEPDQLIVSEGTASAFVFIRDVNGDGLMDLILPSVKINITSIIRWLISRSIPINFNIFLLGEDRRFSDRPDFTKEVKFKIDFSGESDTQAMDLDGDFNGDKRTDFVFATDEDELSIYLGVPDGGDRLFSKKPAAKVGADAYGELSSTDLNGDGYSDMIIYYPQSKERRGMVEILMNMRRLR